MEDTRWRLPHGVLPSHVSDIRGKGIGVSHHHITRASPVDDTQAEVSQDSFLQPQLASRRAARPHALKTERSCGPCGRPVRSSMGPHSVHLRVTRMLVPTIERFEILHDFNLLRWQQAGWAGVVFSPNLAISQPARSQSVGGRQKSDSLKQCLGDHEKQGTCRLGIPRCCVELP